MREEPKLPPVIPATRPEESAHPELWEGLATSEGTWRKVDGKWYLVRKMTNVRRHTAALVQHTLQAPNILVPALVERGVGVGKGD